MPAKAPAAAPEKKRKAAPEKEEHRGGYPADDGAAAGASKIARVMKEFNAQVDAVAAQAGTDTRPLSAQLEPCLAQENTLNTPQTPPAHGLHIPCAPPLSYTKRSS
jgi:hypothetical protein